MFPGSFSANNTNITVTSNANTNAVAPALTWQIEEVPTREEAPPSNAPPQRTLMLASTETEPVPAIVCHGGNRLTTQQQTITM